ncbi:hypothetical protein AB0I98_13730 [Streptomyces sp. NPDC050211]|uniref:hypothetical protein n=1 Tax=Streptomyces sp. NPDC050211 TaxID=3154932 RepID=UPI00343AF87B
MSYFGVDACSAELAELGLETKEFFVLAEVAASPYPAELAVALMIPKASVTTRTCGGIGSY